jgi:UDP-N-acetylglucosamine transferase subunit ALG13
VVVAVGTDHHPFHRLIDWIDGWAARNRQRSVLVQRGTSRPTSACPSEEMLPHAELLESFATASVVICHGGPSTVMDARASGRFPIVVARDPAFGEHVDDHQMRFAAHMRRHGLARVVDDGDLLWATLDEALAHPDRFSVPVETSAISGVVEFAHLVDRLLGVTTPLTPSSPPLASPADAVPTSSVASSGSPSPVPTDIAAPATQRSSR